MIEFIKKTKETLLILQNKVKILYFAYKNPKLSILPKLLILITIGYALSPIDLIPDFIPILGYIDDLIIIPILITISLKLIPQNILDQSIVEANKSNLKLPKNWIAASIIIFIWIGMLGLISWKIFQLIKK